MPLPRRLPPSKPDDDVSLVTRIRAGDAASFEQLFVTCFAELVSFANAYLHSRDAAEDVVQDVFLRVWDNRAAWHVTNGVAQYLYGATRNAALDALKHESVAARWQERELRESAGQSAAHAGTARLEAQELAALVRQTVAALPPRCQEVFRLSRYQRLTQRDVAATLGITVNTVNVQLGRALRAIEAAIQAREGEGE